MPHNNDICQELVKRHHNTPATGHPRRWKILELLSRNYYWPGMTKFAHEYVDTCDTCARTKIFPAKPLGPLKPNEVPEGPWQIITSDLIVGLPKSNGYDAILVTSNRFTKQVHITMPQNLIS